MKWLKSQTSHAHGLGEPVYTCLEGWDLEDLKHEIRNGPDGDRDGIREPKWEVLDALPPEILEAKIREAERAIRSTQHWLAKLKEEALASPQPQQGAAT